MRRITQPSSLLRFQELPLLRVLVGRYRSASLQPQLHSQREELNKSRDPKTKSGEEITAKAKTKKKTMAELDAELQQRMSGLSGDGGEAGVEYEDGKPVAMKRSVKNNMFRYI
ncbi:hypothetical protein K449DRAFT_438927 [Hypoxylon sp. EC38]|nr:hypothetical protein K449DRAFT_438927 [Hypoxylon sp. EC38]